MQWIVKKFEELTPFELYDIIRLRNEVFVVEQNCVFQDADGKDAYCYHLMGYLDHELAVYTRLVPPGISYPDHSSIGRVVSSKKIRAGGYGKLLMERSIEETGRLFGKIPVRIGAQLYLKKFYTAFGFEQSGEIYLEDGIEHIEMTRNCVPSIFTK